MRNGGAVLNDADFQANRLESANGRFAARSGAFDAHFNFTHAVRHRLASGILRDLLCCERSALARAFEANAPSSGPAEQIALHVGDSDSGLIEGGQSVRYADGHV